jgi:UrcA family protein
MRAFAMFAAAAAILAAAPAVAGPELATGQVTVRLGDLDLSTALGAHAALARLTRAAGQACGDRPGVSPTLIWQSDAFQSCRAEALKTAVAQIHTAAIDVAFAPARGQIVQVARR